MSVKLKIDKPIGRSPKAKSGALINKKINKIDKLWLHWSRKRRGDTNYQHQESNKCQDYRCYKHTKGIGEYDKQFYANKP